jgi:hypothetical protein
LIHAVAVKKISAATADFSRYAATTVVRPPSPESNLKLGTIVVLQNDYLKTSPPISLAVGNSRKKNTKNDSPDSSL